MLRLPSARAPNSMRPCIQATILLSFNCATAVVDHFVGGQQVVEAQLAVLEHLLDLRRRRSRGRGKRVRVPTRRSWPIGAVPGVEHRADGRAGVARGGLHEHVLVAGAVFQRRDQQRIQAQAAGQAEVASLAGHADDGLFDGLLDAGGDVGAQVARGWRRRPPVRGARRSARRSRRASRRSVVKKERSRRGPASRDAEDFEEQVAVAVVAGDREPLDFVLVHVGFEAEQLGDAAVEVAEGIGRVLLVLERHVARRGPASASRSGNRRRGRASARWPRRTATGSRPRRRGRGGARRRRCGCWGTGRAA